MSKETERMDRELMQHPRLAEQAKAEQGTTMQQDVTERAAHMLRSVAEGKSFNSAYFWNVTMAMEAMRDGNPRDCRIHLEAAKKLCPNIESYEFTRADIAAPKAVSNG